MFGLGMKSKTKKVLTQHFAYPTQSMHQPLLTQICAEASRQQLNEYDAAIMFMLAQINAITENSERASNFTEVQTNNIKSIISLAKTPYSEILDFVKSVTKAQSISLKTSSDISGIHPFQASNEVPMLDEKGRALILRNRLSPAQVVAPSFVEDWFYLQPEQPKLYERQLENYQESRTNASNKTGLDLIGRYEERLTKIENWEIAYLDEKSLPSSLLDYNLDLTLFRAFIDGNSVKPFGYSDELTIKGEKVFSLIASRDNRPNIVEPLHPYDKWEDVPMANEIGYLLIIRSIQNPERVFELHPKVFEKHKAKKSYFSMGISPKDYEIGYYNPDKNRGWALNFKHVEIYDSEHTVKPFGYSQVLAEDCNAWLEQMGVWFPAKCNNF